MEWVPAPDAAIFRRWSGRLSRTERILNHAITIGTFGTNLDEVSAVRRGAAIRLGADARASMEAARRRVEELLLEARPVYGINTGFGRLATTVISPADLSLLQVNLLRSHACGTGEPLSSDVVRVTLFLRASSLARGRSGIRPETVEMLLAFANGDILPVIPSKGSLGASGDLAPLAHMCLPLLGEGMCTAGGEALSGSEALARLGLEPLRPAAKEGLALINGTPVMTAIASCTLLDARNILSAADAAAAITLEALLGTGAAFDEELLSLRPHPGALASGANLRRMTEGSEIILSHRDCPRVQDPYSLRCTPQVHGATRDAMRYVEETLSVELSSATDNPLMLGSGSFVSGGNFHGQPVALASDHLALAVAELGSISERRMERLLNPDLSGLPAFLSPEPGLNSGLMIAQYTAASLVSENKVLVHPASSDSISVSGAQEDHVSMGTTAARQAAEVATNVRRVVATELYCGFQAHRLAGRGRPGRGTMKALEMISAAATPLDGDRQFGADIEAVEGLIGSGAFTELLEMLERG